MPNSLPAREQFESRSPRDVLCPIVLACDENYAMPLATFLRSLVEANHRHWPLSVSVLTDGFSDDNKQRVQDSIPESSAILHWHLIDLSRYAAYSILQHISRLTYARFEIDRIFGASVGRVIYLDTDTLVLGDLSTLCNADLRGHPLGAVPDYYLDAAVPLAKAQTGVPRVSRYFNAGMLLIDLKRWRDQNVSRRAIEYLNSYPASPYSDQDALNWACDRAWALLPERWNFQAHHNVRIDKLCAVERPEIVHFITAWKPWKASSSSINRGLYNSFRDKTLFRRSWTSKLEETVRSTLYRVYYLAQRFVAAGFLVIRQH